MAEVVHTDYKTALVKTKEFSDRAEAAATQAEEIATGVDQPNGLASLDSNGLLKQKPKLVVESVAELRLLSGKKGETIVLQSYHEGLNKGGGVFYFSETDPYGNGDDSGIVFYANNDNTGSSGYWVRSLDNTVNVTWFGAKGDGVTEDTSAIQASFSSSFGRVFIPSGVYLITEVCIVTGAKEIFGEPGTVLLNGLDRIQYPRGMVGGLIQLNFKEDGSYDGLKKIGTTTGILNEHSNQVSVELTSDLVENDFISFSGYSFGAMIKSSTTDSITIDRTAPVEIPIGTTIYKITKRIDGTWIHDIEFDFNGTESNPRYGYGVLVHAGSNVVVERLRGKNIGSKFVQFTRTIDSVIRDVVCQVGTDNALDGGHGYVVRASGNDCLIEGIRGHKVRHTVDLSAGKRMRVQNCDATDNYSASYLTHSNNSRHNVWINNNSSGAGAGAYSFNPTEGGDQYQTIIGGVFIDNLILRGNSFLDETISISGVEGHYTKSAGYLITAEGTQRFLNSKFFISGEGRCLRIGREGDEIHFENCQIYIYNSLKNALGSDGAGGKIRFKNTKIYFSSVNAYLTGNVGGELIFEDSQIYAPCSSSTVPIFDDFGLYRVKNSDFFFEERDTGLTQGIYWFGLNGGTLDMRGGNEWNNSNGIYRRWTLGDCSVKFGNDDYINSTVAPFSNLVNLTTNGRVEIPGVVEAPSSGGWLAGSSIKFPQPTAGSPPGVVCTSSGSPGVWKTESPLAV